MARTEMFKITPGLFAGASLALWSAVGRTAHVPSLLHSVLLTPIYKHQGYAAIPTNNRPVSLTTALRSLIATALTHELRNIYTHSQPTQGGLQRGNSIEFAIAFESNTLRRELPMATVVDLRKAYDTVLRQKLQDMLDNKLPTALSTAWPVLSPMFLRTKNQRSNQSVRTLVGKSEGDLPSPLLFNLFMDDYIRVINTAMSKRLVKLVLHDVLLLARSMLDMQRVVSR